MSLERKQEKPGIKILFSKGANLERLNGMLEKDYFGGYKPPAGDDRILVLHLGSYATGFGAIQFYCYNLLETDIKCFLKPAFPFIANYDEVVWIKDLDGNVLWQNWDYNEDGSPKKEEKEEQ